MKFLNGFIYVVAGVFFAASLLDQGEAAINAFSLEGIKFAFAFAFTWFQAGGNMIPRVGMNQAIESSLFIKAKGK